MNKLRTKLDKTYDETYDDITGSYKYFVLKITNNQSDDFLKMLSKNDFIIWAPVSASRLCVLFDNVLCIHSFSCAAQNK